MLSPEYDECKSNTQVVLSSSCLFLLLKYGQKKKFRSQFFKKLNITSNNVKWLNLRFPPQQRNNIWKPMEMEVKSYNNYILQNDMDETYIILWKKDFSWKWNG